MLPIPRSCPAERDQAPHPICSARYNVCFCAVFGHQGVALATQNDPKNEYAKKAYDTWVAEASKLGEMYAAVARDAYKPVEKAVTKRAS